MFSLLFDCSVVRTDSAVSGAKGETVPSIAERMVPWIAQNAAVYAMRVTGEQTVNVRAVTFYC